MGMFIHEHDNWTDFRWDSKVIDPIQLKAMHQLGYLAGRMVASGSVVKISEITVR